MLKIAFGFGVVLSIALLLRVPSWNKATVVTTTTTASVQGNDGNDVYLYYYIVIDFNSFLSLS